MKTLALIFLLNTSLLAAKEKPVTPPAPNQKTEAASISSKEINNTSSVLPINCDSFKLYKDTVDYLKTQKELSFTEPQILKAALDINQGCDGADRRFKKVFELLLKSGVNIKKAYEIAVDFSKMNDQKTDSFTVLFRGLFLENNFDFDFLSAYRISLELSAAYPKDWEKLQKDFRAFLGYCQKSTVEELPIRVCAEWTLNLLKYEPLYQEGLYPTFNSLNSFLLKREGPQLPVRERLKLISEILSYGPKASPNFQQALNWLRSPQGAGLQPIKAHQLALQISKNSIKTNELPFESEKIPKPQ